MDFNQITQTITTIGRSPHSSPAKGEEANKLTAISSLFCAALWRCTKPAGFRRLWLVVGALVLCGFASGAKAAESTKPAAEASKVAAPKEATLAVWNQAITVFRSSFAGLNAQERAAQA